MRYGSIRAVGKITLFLITIAALLVSTAAAQQERWVHGILTAKGDAGFQLMALDKGYFAEEGIGFEVVQFESDATLVKALIAGEIDSMEANPTSSLVAISQGADLRFVGATIPGLSHVIYTRSDINSIEDMRGRIIGISGPGALPQVTLQALLDEVGIGFNEVTWSNAGGDAARFKALVAGKVDAVVSGVDFKVVADEDPNVHYIGTVAESLPNYLRYTIITSGRNVERRPEVLTGVLRATARGLRRAIEYRDEMIELTSRTIGKPAEDPSLALVYDTHINERLLAPNLLFDPAAIVWMYDLNRDLGKITREFNVHDYIDTSFAEQAVASLGAFSW
jgi:NitT/TauT family transport system substrate-binding protein